MVQIAKNQMTTLSELLRSTQSSEAFEVPANWLQGRTAYGGLSAALALQAALNQTQGQLPPLTAAHISFIAPMAGALRFEAQLLRQGKSATTMSVDGFSAEQIGLRASFILASARPSSITHQLSTFPTVQPPSEYPDLPVMPGAPAFLANFDVRYLNGNTPVCGAQSPELLAWVRFSYSVADVHPAVALLAMGDCLAPAAMACFTEFAPASSMNWTLHLTSAPVVGEWYLLQSKSIQSGNGYSYQTMQAWNVLGEPVLFGCQTVAIFA